MILGCANLAVVSGKSMIRYSNFTSSYSSEWYTYDKAGTETLRMTLRMRAYPMVGWDESGTSGFYMGIGFNTFDMDEGDAAVCTLYYTSPSDTVSCADSYFHGEALPMVDDTEDVTMIDSKINVRVEPLTGIKVVDAFATFERPLTTTDTNTDQDTKLKANFGNSLIYAYGPIKNGGAKPHALNFGHSSFYIGDASSALAGLVSHLSISIFGLFIVIALAF